jgi:orotidine-5'-phosphate decarboxylase
MTSVYFADKLIENIQQKKSIICVGLDPRIEGDAAIPKNIMEKSHNDPNEAIWQFNKAIIDATHDLSAVYKPQSAFYEQYDAIDALKKTISYIHSLNCLVILDAKRNDIGTTCDAYAIAAFKVLKADAITINSYLGIDGVSPFLKYIPEGKGMFLLLKTSNKSSGDFQDLFAVDQAQVDPKKIDFQAQNLTLTRNYILMTRLMRKWGENSALIGNAKVLGEKGYSSLGGVVGATYPEQMQVVRNEAPKNFILIPGYGAQGGTAKDILAGVNSDGLGAIVNASRSINFAYTLKPYKEKYSPEQFAEAARKATIDMQIDLNTALKNANKIAY